MNGYISSDLNMVRELDPKRHELALLQAQWLEKGGTIAVLAGPSFEPPPKRYEPPPSKKVAKPATKPAATDTPYMDKITRRDMEREERVAQRAKDKERLVDRIRKLAETMTYAQAVEQTGMSRRTLQRIAAEERIQFVPAPNGSNPRKARITDAQAEKYAERIRSFKEVGLTRNQATNQLGVTFRTFNALLDRFGIDYPKSSRGPQPAFFPKPPKQ
ncbi:hypothetical protein [Pseudomonas fluorescens]|uniref:hypothetical protein n=1 Tax=Pseudomonas fluorescens TaxID=294 RepID=UPI00286265ED|nr:hypothetical protein [Pseudomonas fluorescens]MDR6163524.1 putative DNA-binding protein (UPF0251 family) [Pseudomonas fluorescens]